MSPATTETSEQPRVSNNPNQNGEPGQPVIYQVRIRGHLGAQWRDWFGGLTVTLADSGDTLLTGPVVDQAALYGLLKRVRDLGLALVSVAPIAPVPAPVSDSRQ